MNTATQPPTAKPTPPAQAKAAQAPSTEAQKSNERLSFTAFLALAIHAVIILGVAFTADGRDKVAPTLNITLANHRSDKAPDQADYLAQFDQEASGDSAEARELTAREIAEATDSTVNQITPPPERKSAVQMQRDEAFITSVDGTDDRAQSERSDSLDVDQTIEAEDRNTPQVNPEIASLRAKLDKLQQEFAKRPRIRRMTSVATKGSSDAAYLNEWTQKVEMLGNENFPRAALDEEIFGSLRMSVLVNSDGTVDNVEILKPSGYPVLDQAAVQIVRLASPFKAFPPEILATADQLDIIRTWRFEITGLKTGG